MRVMTMLMNPFRSGLGSGTCSKVGLCAGLVLSLAAVGCAKKAPEPTSNQALLDEFGGDEYADDFVTADKGGNHADQGQAVSAEAQLAVQDALQEVYLNDFASCLEQEMKRLDNRYIAGPFTVELTINTSGQVEKAEFIKWDIKERRTVEGQSPRVAEEFPACIQEAVKEWEFEPAPEAEYIHTYTGKVGEAW